MADTKKKSAADSVTVTVQGRLGGNPESRETKSGKRISNASIAVGQRVKNAAGHWEDGEVMWFRLVCFGSDLDEMEKGDKVLVTGRLAMQTWEDREGNQRTTYEILVNDATLVTKPKPKADSAVADDDYPSEA